MQPRDIYHTHPKRQRSVNVVTTNAPDGRTRHLATGEISCRLWQNCIAYQEERKSTHQWECSFDDPGLSSQFGGYDNKLVVIEGVEDSNHFLKINGAESGNTILVMSQATIDEDRIIVNEEDIDALIGYGNDADVDAKASGLRGSKPLKLDRRRLTSTTGTLNTLVVRVNALDRQPAPATILSEDIFQDEWCLKSQYNRCSYNQLRIQEYQPGVVNSYVPTAPNAPGVVEININKNAVGNTKEQMQADANAKLREMFGVSDPGNLFDLVLFCMPPDLSDGDWLAYAYIGRWDSYYNDDWCQAMSSQMHEVGHSIGLDHSGEYEGDHYTQIYGDQTDMMGFSFRADDLPAMCFNPAKNWQLGWYAPKQLEINPNTDLSTEPITLVLNGVVDYDSSPIGNYIVVKIGDFYIGFNRAASFNIGVQEAANQVTVIEKLGSPSSSTVSKIAGKLGVGDAYTIEISALLQVEVKYVQNINGKDAVVEAKLLGDSVVECQGGYNAEVEVELITDYFYWETSWGIADSFGQYLFYKDDFPSTGLYTQTVGGLCRGMEYYFIIFDTYGDGICCTYGEGGFIVKYGDQILFTGGEFTDQQVIPFTLPLDATSAPTAGPTFVPTSAPTASPTSVPTSAPTANPTSDPTSSPTVSPTTKPPTQSPSAPPIQSAPEPTNNDALVQGSNSYMSAFAGTLCDNSLVYRMYTDYGFQNIVFETRNGGWTSTINLPKPFGIPEGSTLTVRVNSHWSVYVMGQGVGWNVPRRGEIGFVLSDSEWIQTSGFEYEPIAFDCPADAIPTDTPTESPTKAPTDSPTGSPTSATYVVSGNDAFMSTVGGELCENEFLEGLFATHREVRIETRNGGWTGTINVPNAQEVPQGSVLTVNVRSAWSVNVFTPEAGWSLTNGSEIAFVVTEDKEWQQISGFELLADESTCSISPPTNFPTQAPIAIESTYPRGKKGICFTLRNAWENGSWTENLPKIKAMNPSWAYSWGPEPAAEVPTAILPDGGLEILADGTSLPSPEGIDFVPMLWGYYDSLFEDFTDRMLAPNPKMVFGFNEPDSPSQSNISVERALEGWERLASKVTANTDEDTVLVSPSCVQPTGSWCTSFMEQADAQGLRVDAIGFHWYGGASAQTLFDKLTETYEAYRNRPIVITEFAVADWTATTPADNKFSPEQILNFMMEALPWLEQTEWILSYAWFSFETDSAEGWSSALVEGTDASTGEVTLTPLGQYYSEFTGTFLGVNSILT